MPPAASAESFRPWPNRGCVCQRAPPSEADEEDAAGPLKDRLIAELTEHRTPALRDALAENPAVTFQAVLHNFVLFRIPRQQEAVPVAGGAERDRRPHGLQGGMGWTIGKTSSGLVRVNRPKELPFLEGQRDMRPSDSAGASSPDSEGKRVAAAARTSHSCAPSDRLKDFIALIASGGREPRLHARRQPRGWRRRGWYVCP